VDAVQVRQHRAYLVPGEHRGNTPRALGPHRLLDARQLDLKHLAIQEEKRAERLVLGGRRHVSLDGEPGEECLDLARAHLARVPSAMVDDEAVHPPRVRPFRPQAEVLQACGLPDLVQELWLGHRLSGGTGMGCLPAHVVSG
jgi:hypothetical protein